jgi:hypothetical protein
MNRIAISGWLQKFVLSAISRNVIAVLVVATVASVVPARAQVSDAWKSAAIIGGSTAAGAYVGHKVGGNSGAYVGAAVGAAAGYAIDRRRRQNEYNNDYSNDDPYGDNGDRGSYGNDDRSSANGRYNRGGNPYPSDNPDPNYYAASSRRR